MTKKQLRWAKKAEKWFQSFYKPYQSDTDEFNTVFAGYIPDVLNKKYKYIIEVDGSIHDLSRIQLKDRKKDTRFLSIGYDVIRIKAYDIESFKKAMERIVKLKGPHFTPGKIFTELELRDFKNKYNTG